MMEEQKNSLLGEEWQSYSVIAVFFGIMLIWLMALLIKGEDDYSPQEKRYLTQMSNVVKNDFFDGTLQTACETYLADQLPGRIGLLAMESAIRSVTEREIGDIYIGSDGYLFAKVTEDAVGEQLQTNETAVTDFLAYCEGLSEPVPAKVMIVPTKSLILEDDLPDGAPIYNQGAVLDELQERFGEQFIDLRYTFLDDLETDEAGLLSRGKLYYKTDHHWTLYGALLAAGDYLQGTGHEEQAANILELLDSNATSITEVSDAFRGTQYASTLYPFAAYDTIYSYKAGGAHSFKADGVKYSSLYDETALGTEDEYSYYLGGNASVCVIEGAEEATEKLLIIKDSYANCFVPFLTDTYQEIHLLDLRYYHEDVGKYMQDNGITEVLVLYNADNFLTDTNLVQLPTAEDLAKTTTKDPSDETPAHESDGAARALMEQILTAISERSGEETVMDTVVSYGENKYDRNFDYLYQIDEELAVDGCIAYASTGMKADEISIIKPAEGKSGRVRRALNTRIQRREDDFRAYVPEEADKISGAQVFDEGDFIVLVISENPSEIEELIEDIMKGE